MRTIIPTEAGRGCGHRKIGAMYLVARDGIPFPCFQMPWPIDLCPCCGHGIKFSRGIQWLAGDFFAGEYGKWDCVEKINCSCCPFRPTKEKKALMWVGESFYKTPQDFKREAHAIGISKRIVSIPKDLILGETWILLAHNKAVERKSDPPIDATEDWIPTVKMTPGIFYAFQPQKIEKIYAQGTVTEEELKRCKERGITPVEVPNVARHQGSVYDTIKEDNQLNLFEE